MRFADNEKVYVATYKEIIIGFITFALILFVLYPKELIMDQILKEKSNYDLSVLYLKNMLRNDPKNEKLILTLAQKSIKSQNRDLALSLLELLKKSNHIEVQKQAYLLSYELLKQNYFFLENKHETHKMQKLRKKLEKTFLFILDKHFYEQKDLPMLYKEAMFLRSQPAQYQLVREMLQKKPKDIKLLSDALYLATKLKRYDEALNYVQLLTQVDKKHIKRWNNEHYFLLTQLSSYKKMEAYLLHAAQSSTFWQKKLIDYYLSYKQYKKAADYYMTLFYRTSSYKKRKKLWTKAIKTLVSGNLLKDAVKLGSKYEDYFIKDKSSRLLLLKLYLSANEVQKAKRLSRKILKVMQ
ncbi:hypothetical protein [Sulfurimonas paralvinellae]|uniref:Uncharacterized protein n=1 Tax=Sulfurimonas paralvinellae TaxID=317658 RepID=A0A7M1B858_9BACT|nr:hypothetical protein [Sulfurimonas paralvinellae]QOP44912.1 hypothetical protein FM071_00815 [Sulfurimonas paralvinellae]